MAAWQCCFYIAPKENVKTLEKPNEDESLWEKGRLPIRSLKSLEKYLPIQASWSKNITQYGDLEGTCIEIFKTADGKFDISIRLDLPKLTEKMYKKILNLIIKSNCMICVIETQKVYEGNEESLKQVIKESIAFRLGQKNNDFVAKL